MAFLRRRAGARVVLGFLTVGGALCTALAGEAWAGCGDGACGRVDWTEVTEMDQGAPAAAKLHGTYAWEASPDFWGTHPLAGTVSGYIWLTCLSPSGTSAVCRGQLASEMAKAGTSTTVTFSGSFYDYDAGASVRPAGLFAEGEPGSATVLTELTLGGGPINPDVCRTALGMPPVSGDGGIADAGGAGGGGTGTGGAAGNPPSNDDGGCSTSGRGAPSSGGFAVALFVVAILGIARRRSCD